MKVRCPNCGVSFDTEALILSPAEQRVYDLMISGKNVKEIAAVLGKSPRTIDTQKRSVFAKLGLHSLHDLYQHHYSPREDVK